MTSGVAKKAFWFDVEDLFSYALTESRPSGIQRLAFEVYLAAKSHPVLGDRVRFIRHHPAHPVFIEVPWATVEALFRRLSATKKRPAQTLAGQASQAGTDAASAGEPDASVGRRGLRGALGRWATPQFKVALGRFIGQLRATLSLVRPLLLALAANIARPRRTSGEMTGAEPGHEHRSSSSATALSAEAPFAAGDVLLCFGSPWFNTVYVEQVRSARDRHNLRFALLVYDIIPVRRPEWCDHNLVQVFVRWLHGVLPISDSIFSISRASAVDVERYAAEKGVVLKGPVEPIPIGSGFTDLEDDVAEPVPSSPPPVQGEYALIVSTIEARKNHVLLFRVWRRLLEEMPADKVPTLVFAGRVGWLVADLMQQLKNADYLGGKIKLVEDPSDAELTQLYKGCLFTLFPSLYEGWGLPVTESLMAGKPCILSNRTSLPEAGGELGRYFDPENLEDAVRVIRGVLEDRPGLAGWEAEVKARFEPVPWSAAAHAVLESLEAG